MAGNSNILKSFLVRIGYQHDDAGRRRIEEDVDSITKRLFGLGAAIEGAVAAMAVATVKFADSFERLYYSSQRTGAAIKNIKAFQYAIAQTGGTAQGAQSTLEGFARFLRSTPAAGQFLANLGVSTTSKGRLRDTVDILQDVGDRLRAMPFYQAKQYANLLGIDEDTLIALSRGMGRFRNEYEQMYAAAGVNSEEIGAKSAMFMQGVRRLLEVLGLLKDKVLGDLIDRYGPRLEEFTQYVLKNLPLISDKILAIADAFLTMADYIGKGADAIGGWQTVGALVLTYFSTKWLAGMLGAIGTVTGSAGLGGLAAMIGLPVASGVVGYGAGSSLYDNKIAGTEFGDKLGEGIAKFLAAWGSGTAKDALVRNGAAGPGNAGAVVDFFRRAGWSQEQATGIAANLQQESGFNPQARNGNAVGLAQWLGPRKEEFARLFGHSLEDSSFNEQLQFIQHELTRGGEQRAGQLLRGATTAGEAAGIVSRYYERPGDGDAEASRRARMAEELQTRLTPPGASTASLSQNTTINVHGAGDPNSTAQQIAAEQTRVQNDAVRTLRGAVR